METRRAKSLALLIIGAALLTSSVPVSAQVRTRRRPTQNQNPPPIQQPGSGRTFQGPAPTILDTDYQNLPYNTSGPNWARNITHNNIFMQVDAVHAAKFEWTQVLDPNSEDGAWIGASGYVVSPDQSDRDDPFLHPFGFDWEFFLAPDPKYRNLAAPTTDSEYVDAAQRSGQLGFPAPIMLGVEWDSGLVPDAYRAQEGDRVCVFGRWIVDTGHDDFHTEIHPPALLVAARPYPKGSSEKTQVTLLTRPYLVNQTFFDGHGLEGHLLDEVGKINTLRSTRVEAHPIMAKKSFQGFQEVFFTVRPPSARKSPNDQLQVAFHFTVRTGVTVQILKGDDPDSVKVMVMVNSDQYTAPPLPTRHDVTITRSDLDALNKDAGEAYLATEVLDILNPVADYFLHKGILTDSYDSPHPVLGQTTVTTANNLPGKTPVTLNNDQPYPLAGSMSLTWIRG